MTPKVVGSGGVVCDRHHFGGLRSGPWVGQGSRWKAVYALTRVSWEFSPGLRRPHALRQSAGLVLVLESFWWFGAPLLVNLVCA